MIVIILLLLISIINTNSYITNLPLIEWNALVDFYQNTNGEYWIWKNETLAGLKWNFTNGINNTNVCKFQGLSCTCDNTTDYHPFWHEELINGYNGYYYANYYDDTLISPSPINCNINKIYLIRYNLTGSLPNSIGSFKNLTHIHIMENDNLIGNYIYISIYKEFFS
jgi:hypothetical protein